MLLVLHAIVARAAVRAFITHNAETCPRVEIRSLLENCRIMAPCTDGSCFRNMAVFLFNVTIRRRMQGELCFSTSTKSWMNVGSTIRDYCVLEVICIVWFITNTLSKQKKEC